MKQIRKRLTYANVMSSLAVFLVLGGATAVAATKIGSNEIKGNAITTGKIKKEAVSRAKIKKSAIDASRLADGAVGTSKIGDGAVTTSKLADGSVTAAKVAGGSINRASLGGLAGLIPQGYAFVESNGLIEPQFTQNIPNGTNPSTGTYCFTVPFTPKHAQATAGADGDSNEFASVSLPDAGGVGGCPAGTNVRVELEEVSDNPVDEEFFLVVW